jgi:hypothetical protein
LLSAAHERGDVVGATMNRDGAVAFATMPRRWPWQRQADSGERPGSALIRTATVLLFLLGLGLLTVSYAAQYRYVLAQRHQPTVSVMEAGALDAGMAIFSLLALGLARAGLAAKVERALIVACAAGSAIMNYAAADAASPRSVLAFCMPPVFLAVVVDRVVVSVRRHVLGMRDGHSPWAIAGRIGLYGLRFVLSPWPTATGLRRWVLVATPLPAAGASAAATAIAAAPPAGPRPVTGTARQGTKTSRFLALVEDRHGPLADLDLDRVSPIAAQLAPEVNLDPGSARTALGKAVKAARNGTAG